MPSTNSRVATFWNVSQLASGDSWYTNLQGETEQEHYWVKQTNANPCRKPPPPPLCRHCSTTWLDRLRKLLDPHTDLLSSLSASSASPIRDNASTIWSCCCGCTAPAAGAARWLTTPEKRAPINQSINHPSFQSINQSNDQSVIHLFNQSINQSNDLIYLATRLQKSSWKLNEPPCRLASCSKKFRIKAWVSARDWPWSSLLNSRSIRRPSNARPSSTTSFCTTSSSSAKSSA